LENMVRPIMTDTYWKNKNVLVTGCTGLLGSWLTIKLVENGANVIGLIRDLIPKSNLYLSGFHNRIETVRGSLTDYELLLRIFNEYEIEIVFHLAAQTIVTIANRSPLSTFESNIKGTWNLLEAAKQTDIVKKIVVASSDKAYGDHDRLPYDEEYPLQGRHPYDVSKSCVDLIAQSYYFTYKMPIAIARCGNIYGGGDLNFNRIIPGTIRSLYFKERPIIRSDGTPRRDYIYVEDAVNAYLTLAKGLDDKKIWGQPFNFSSENPVTVLAIVNEIINISPKSNLIPKILGKGKLMAEIHDQFLSSLKAKKLLNWDAHYSLKEGLSETVKWFTLFFDNQSR